MARIDQGNALTTPMLQPGAKFQNDGYGLWTGTLTFKIDKAGSSASFYRGATCPIASFNFCKMHKTAVQLGELNLDTWTAEYVGIDPSKNSGFRTDCQVSASQGLTTDHITAHPNFFELDSAGGFSGDPIAGVGASPGTINTPNYAPAGNNEYTGNNGATFEKQTGGKFLGFKVAQYKTLYGKTNYLAPQTSFTGHFYTNTDATVQGMMTRVGKTSGNGQFNSIRLLPDYLGSSFTLGTAPNQINQLLLAQVSTEDFGTLYKVNYEVRYNRYGFNKSVYADA